MLGYISSTRKKSCRQCVKAKRRCDLGYPCCRRCFTKTLDCAYPNASVREAEVIIRQTTPDLVPPATTTTSSRSASTFEGGFGLDMDGIDIDPALFQQQHSSSGSSASGGTSEDAYDNNAWPIRLYLPPPRARSPTNSHSNSPSQSLKPQFSAPTYLNDAQVLFLVSGLRSFVPALAYNGHNAFIHSQLYPDAQQPSAYQDACALSALYMAKTKRNIPVLTKTIEAKVTALIATGHTWTLEEHLAAVQALIIYQSIRLFDPTLCLQEAAAPHNELLALWAAHLWKRSFNCPLPLTDCHASWVFYESLRRTVMISVFLRGAWSCITRGGLCDQVPVLARLPLTTDDRLWVEGKEAFETRTPCGRKAEVLVAYGDWSSKWKSGEHGDDPRGLGEFQRLLLVACKGKEDPRLFFKEDVSIG
ncbi:hypothetical protein CC80DRAFT_407846 [Byssothecium circinans]|uniref:Zn(2)-C6 fungal-type domain-containing protein n=1 Tax=Byssothecium circinans TaxID=147558 RepID=A0A6A5U4J4_9PLEO|nr:hypothetical protein CC80DRAFT_407846 [Byssothecium circinans]